MKYWSHASKVISLHNCRSNIEIGTCWQIGSPAQDQLIVVSEHDNGNVVDSSNVRNHARNWRTNLFTKSGGEIHPHMRARARTLGSATFAAGVITGDYRARTWQGRDPGKVGAGVEGSGGKARPTQECGSDNGGNKRPFRGRFHSRRWCPLPGQGSLERCQWWGIRSLVGQVGLPQHRVKPVTSRNRKPLHHLGPCATSERSTSKGAG